jgi:hypothetical protein
MLAALAWPLAGGLVFHRDDLGRFHLPLRQFYARCLANGDDPRWCPDLFCGFDLNGEGQAGLYHPLHRLLYGTLPLATAFHLELWLNYPALFFGMGMWLRRLGVAHHAAWFGALLFTFSGFNLLHYVHVNAIAVIAHLPWLLFSIETLRATQSARVAAWCQLAIALLTTSQVLAGYPQYVAFSLVVELAYGCWRTRSPRFVLGVAMANALGLMGGGIQLLPTWEALHGSVRASPSLGGLAIDSLDPLNLVQLVAPYLFRARHYNALAVAVWPMHEQGLYAGAVVPPLLAWLWIRRNSLGAWRPLVVGALVLGTFALVLSFGTYTPFFGLYARLPLAGMFRVPGRFILLVHLSTAVLAAVALVDLGRDREEWRRLWPLAVPTALCLFAGCAFWAWGIRYPGSRLAAQLADSRAIVSATGWAAMAALAVLVAARGRRLGLALVVGIAAADQAVYGLDSIYRFDAPRTVADLAAATPRPPGRRGERVQVERNDALLGGTHEVEGYVGLRPRSRLDYSRTSSLQVGGAGWRRAADGGWIALAAPLPRARLVSAVVVSHAPGKDIERIDVGSTALVDEPVALSAAGAGRASLHTDRPGSIAVDTDSSGRCLLVVSERHHAGWRASVDGRPARLLRVNGDFIGCVVDGGKHVVELRFDPESFRAGAGLSVAGGVLMMVVFARSLARVRWARSGRSRIVDSARSAVLRARRATRALRAVPATGSRE